MRKSTRRIIGGALSSVPGLLWGAFKSLPGLPGYIDDSITWLSWIGIAWGWGMTMPLWFEVFAVSSFLLGMSLLTWDWWTPRLFSRWLPHKPTKESEDYRERTLRTVEEICEEYHNLSLRRRHSLNGEFKSPDIGKWLTIVNEELKWKPIVDTDSIVVHVSVGIYEVRMHFSRKLLKELAHRTHGDCILAEGRIADVGGFGLMLQDCELISINQGEYPKEHGAVI